MVLGSTDLIGKIYADIERLFNAKNKAELIDFKEQYAQTLFALSGCSARTMNEAVNVSATKLDHYINIIDVKASGSHVCGYQDAIRSRSPEAAQGLLSLAL